MDIEYTNSQMPRQKVSRSVKETNKWKHDCVDAIIANTKFLDSKRRRPLQERKRNYDLFNNIIDIDHFKHITNPFTLSKDGANNFKLPATLQPYDVIFPIFNVLFGEEHKRFFNPIMRVVNDTAIKDKEEELKAHTLQALQEYLLRNVQPDPNNPEAPPQTPEEVIKKAHSSFKDMKEETANMFLSFYKKRFRLKDTTAKGFKDWLLAGEEFYRIEKVAKEAILERANPLQTYIVLPENTDSVEDAVQILEENFKTINEIIDEFYEVLTPTQIDELENYYDSVNANDTLLSPLTIQTVNSLYDFQGENNINRIPVYRVRWKSFRKQGTFYYIDPQTGKENSIIVDESWMWDKKDPQQRVVWFWIQEAWEGIRIGADIYLDDMIRRRPQQFRSFDNLSKCKLGYVGRICSAVNSMSTSLMDRIVPWLYLYFVIWYDTELALATNPGKIGLIDVSTVPDGWDVEKWFYYAKAMKIGWTNSMNEGNKRMGINQNNSQLNKELNLEMGNYIQFNISLLQEIERKIQNTAGVPPQRLGAISNQELVGNVERSITQSSLVTEDLFRMHNMTKLDICTAVVEVAKDVYKDGSTVLQYVTDDLQDVLFKIDGEMFNEADYGCFATDDNKDMEVLEAMKSHAKFALQNDQMAFYQLADIYTSESVSQIRTELRNYYATKKQQQQQAQQQEADLQRENIAAQQQMHQEQMSLAQYKIDSDNATKIQVASIGVYARQQELDQDNDGIPDPIELANTALKEREIMSKDFLENLKLQAEAIKTNKQDALERKKLTVKEKEIASKERIAKEKDKVALQIARTNKNKYDK